MDLDLAISPCPNDTYIFYHLLEPGFTPHTFRLHLEDVEELNRRAMEEQRHAMTKLSFFAIAALREKYELLNAGGALGRGCGPLLISGEPLSQEELEKRVRNGVRILIPGRWTTANLLVHLYLDAAGADLSRVEFVPARYDRIIRQLKEGEESLGVIIHEERFTYKQQGLFSVQDLGEWWEKETSLPIPLGGIAIRKDVPEQVRREVEEGIRRSLLESRQDITRAWPFIQENAQALEEDVIRSHIQLYVNDFSLDFGEEGRHAIQELFRRAERLPLP